MKSVEQMLKDKGQSLVCIAADASVFQALELLAAKNIGALVVMDGERLAGIFSERDYARKVILQGKSSRDTPVREIMTTRVVCVGPANTVDDCMALMTERRIRHLPVLEHGKLAGMLSIGDLVKDVISEQRQTIEQLESYIHS